MAAFILGILSAEPLFKYDKSSAGFVMSMIRAVSGGSAPMMLFHKFKQLAKAIKWHREVRQAVSTHLPLLKNPSDFALGGLTPEDESHLVILVNSLAGLMARSLSSARSLASQRGFWPPSFARISQ